MPSLSLRESVRAGISKRCDYPLVASRSALLIIDVQKYCCEVDRPGVPEYYKDEALPRMLDNIRDLLDAFRQKRDGTLLGGDARVDADARVGARGSDDDNNDNDNNDDNNDNDNDNSNTSETPPEERHRTGFPEVVFVVIQSMTNDGRDTSIDYKLSGPYFRDIPTVASTYDEIFLPGSLTPDRSTGKGDIVVTKTACSAFATTNLDVLLRTLFVEQLVVCGQLTDQCVESAVRDAADLGFLVTVAEDACAAHSRDEHRKGLSGMKGFSRIVSTQQILQEINRQY